jgi:hypothetical protein
MILIFFLRAMILISNCAHLRDALFQGQALAKVNIGNVLDSCADWPGALQAYEEGYRYYLDVFLSKSQKILSKLACCDLK